MRRAVCQRYPSFPFSTKSLFVDFIANALFQRCLHNVSLTSLSVVSVCLFVTLSLSLSLSVCVCVCRLLIRFWCSDPDQHPGSRFYRSSDPSRLVSQRHLRLSLLEIIRTPNTAVDLSTRCTRSDSLGPTRRPLIGVLISPTRPSCHGRSAARP